MPKTKNPNLRFTEGGFTVTTEALAKAEEKKVRTEQEVTARIVVAKSLAAKVPAPPVQASGDIWLL